MRAQTESAQLVVHLLDYISVDYPAFVKDGKVLDEGEYKEQQEFAAQVQTLLAQLPDVRERADLLAEAERLRARIDAQAPGEEVAKAATDLRWRVIGAYDIAVVPKRSVDLQRARASMPPSARVAMAPRATATAFLRKASIRLRPTSTTPTVSRNAVSTVSTTRSRSVSRALR